jgi:3-isopropylmalate/(R)-2-methylmalate dehydratase large subunit
LGLTQPGATVVCGDSHTSTHGAFGALAFGIGTSEVAQVLATQCLLQRKARTMAINVAGRLQPGVTAKDLILAIIAKLGVGGGTGYVFEYRGEAIEALTMEERMTVCNMSIEAGARAGMIAPDRVTFDYLKGRPHAPKGEAWDAAVARWSLLPSDPDARFDAQIHIDATAITPMITYGTDPGMAMALGGTIPEAIDENQTNALEYMQFQGGTPLLGTPVDVVFIGSCTNSRISDMREAARVMRGRKVAEGVRVLVVPGSRQIKDQAEAEGLDQIFLQAGAQWREPGCSMCIAMNGDMLQPGQIAVSTSNRNFKGRQGLGSRTLLASPATAAASAVRGVVADARSLQEVAHAGV